MNELPAGLGFLPILFALAPLLMLMVHIEDRKVMDKDTDKEWRAYNTEALVLFGLFTLVFLGAGVLVFIKGA